MHLAYKGDVLTSVWHFKILSDCWLWGQDQSEASFTYFCFLEVGIEQRLLITPLWNARSLRGVLQTEVPDYATAIIIIKSSILPCYLKHVLNFVSSPLFSFSTLAFASVSKRLIVAEENQKTMLTKVPIFRLWDLRSKSLHLLRPPTYQILLHISQYSTTTLVLGMVIPIKQIIETGTSIGYRTKNQNMDRTIIERPTAANNKSVLSVVQWWSLEVGLFRQNCSLTFPNWICRLTFLNS